MEKSRNRIREKGHYWQICEGCGKKRRQSNIILFCGHYLCGHCKRRKVMPLVGYKKRSIWDAAEKKILLKKRFYPSLTWQESKYLFNLYFRIRKLSYETTKRKIREMRWMIKKNHRWYRKGGDDER